ncbi:MAG: hypothetical protein L6R41_006960 [Letrouitia leprolyta]|nr:MAG: hypothetical protein L6R41_006960 [Letrouitia leprolyta]
MFTSQLFNDLQDKNRLNLEHIHHKDNGIQLCVACHRSYDNSYPAWVFIPVDIDYFIGFQNGDYLRRTRSARPGQSFPARQVPSVQQYLQRGGLYRAYLQRNYFFRHTGLAHVLQPGPSPLQQGPMRWHGDPLAALSRGIKMMGVAPSIFSTDVRSSLLNLSVLYDTHDGPPSAAPAKSASSRPGPASDDPSDRDGEGKTKKPKTPQPSHPPAATGNGKEGKAVGPKASDKGGCTQHQVRADSTQAQMSAPRRSGRIEKQRQYQATLTRRKEQARIRRMLEDPPDKQLRREIAEGVWKWGPLSSSHEAMTVAKTQQGEHKSPLSTRQYQRFYGLLSPNTSSRA